MLQAAIDDSQTVVNGDVRVLLYKGNVIVTGADQPIRCLMMPSQRLRMTRVNTIRQMPKASLN